jgi:protocatechuate 3,4-dioxygenase alpha subunit
VAEGTPGRIRIFGTVYDGEGVPIPDALIETWQANANGEFADETFRGLGRCPTDDDGVYTIFTVKPGSLGDGQAKHIDVNVFARGMLNRCVTRIYFADEDNAGDPVLESVPEDRRETLIARPTDDGYRFDVHVQGEGETVFFKV